jgi:hypothetical protein
MAGRIERLGDALKPPPSEICSDRLRLPMLSGLPAQSWCRASTPPLRGTGPSGARSTDRAGQAPAGTRGRGAEGTSQAGRPGPVKNLVGQAFDQRCLVRLRRTPPQSGPTGRGPSVMALAGS